MFSNKKFAFTLAEVMVTMSIVGVVAAMTIPTLHYQRVKREYSAKLKNFYSRMNNAILDMQMDKGSFSDMQLVRNEEKDPGNKCGYNWYIANLDPYYGHEYVDATHKTVYFRDGSKLILHGKYGCLDVDYDVNGDKGPNRQGFDQYRFLYCFDNGSRVAHFGREDIFFGTYGSGLTAANTTRAQMVAKCGTKTDTSDGRLWCTKLLENDQWEFKSDYPWKF